MALQDVTLPKRYKNGRVLFEQTLDAWRLAAQTGFATVNLNLTQLARDCFSTGYNFDNDGAANLTTPLQDQINDLATGATPITGTTSDSFSINTDGATAVLTTTALTALRTFTFPDITGTFVVTEGAQTINGAKTFTTRVDVNLTTTQLRLAYTAGAVYTDVTTNSAGYLLLSPTGGRVGIYTASAPVAILQVGDSSSSISIGGAPTVNGSGFLYLINSNTVKNWSISSNDILAGAFQISRSTAAGGSTFTTPDLLISSSGDAGIGTTSPDAKLDVLSTTEQIRQTYTDGSVYASHLVNSSGYYSNTATGKRYGFGISPTATGHFYGGASAATTLRVTADVTFDVAFQIGSTNGYALVYNSTTDLLTINRDAPLGTGSAVITIKSTGEILLPDVDPPTANYANRNSFLKAWINCATGGTTINSSYNVSSVADNGTGREEIFWNTDFAAATYPLATHVHDSTNSIVVYTFSTATSSTELRTYDIDTASLVDSSIGVFATGDQ